MSIANQIVRLRNIREDIYAALVEKGVTVPDGTKYDALSTLIDQIVAGKPQNVYKTTFALSSKNTTGTVNVPWTPTALPSIFVLYDNSATAHGNKIDSLMIRSVSGFSATTLGKGPGYGTWSISLASGVLSINYTHDDYYYMPAGTYTAIGVILE